jgi:NADPH:quinone reductase-like Zn-dependent oxidoreductase
MFSLLLCLSAGIRPIITSSSDDKLRAVQKLAPEGAIGAINYKTSPGWGAEAQKLTGGLGVDIVVENGGLATIEQSLAAIGRRGLVSLVGFLGGLTAPRYPDTVMPVLLKSATMRYVFKS